MVINIGDRENNSKNITGEQDRKTAPFSHPCKGCCYGKNHEICFPCWKDILGQKGLRAWKQFHLKEKAD